MRPIEFRVFNKNIGEYLDDCEVKDITLQFDDENGDLVFEQFTGLLDKNGKKIYEGDIVQYRYWYGSLLLSRFEVHKAEIKFENGEFYPRESSYGCEDSWYSWKKYDFKVLGNVFENKELLE